MTQDELWRRVHAALDERRNPLQDPGTLEALESNPDALGEVERLVQRLGPLCDPRPGAARPESTRSWSARAAAVGALAAGIAILFAVLEWTPMESPGAPALEQAPALAAPSRSRVLSYRVSVARADDHGQVTATRAGLLGEARFPNIARELRLELQPNAPARYAALPLTTIVIRNSTRNQP